jgi:type IV pilus assembly protein PilX
MTTRPRSSACHRARPGRQRGITLVVTLIILLLITIVGVSSMRGNLLQEQMAGNSRDRGKALQAAEAAAKRCLEQVNDASYPAAKVQTPAAVGTPQLWDVDANWAAASTVSEPVALANAGLAQAPRCIVEALGAGSGNFRVTARAVGGSNDSVVILQATYSPE